MCHRVSRDTYADADEELVEVDVAIAVGVEELHERGCFLLRDPHTDLAEPRVELLGVDLVVAVEGVEVPERPAEATDGLGAAGLDLILHSLENYTKKKQEIV